MNGPREWLYEQMLVVRCQVGDDRAFEELVCRYGERLRYYVARVSGRCDDEAADLVQDVWLDVYRKVTGLRSPAAFRVWLYRIARDKALADLRRRRRRPAPVEDIQMADLPQEEPQFAADEAALIHACLGRLSVDHREVLTLRFLEEMSYEDIARLVGCEVGTVRSRIHYAKLALRRMMEDSDNE